jgi:hypothetical protein
MFSLINALKWHVHVLLLKDRSILCRTVVTAMPTLIMFSTISQFSYRSGLQVGLRFIKYFLAKQSKTKTLQNCKDSFRKIVLYSMGVDQNINCIGHKLSPCFFFLFRFVMMKIFSVVTPFSPDKKMIGSFEFFYLSEINSMCLNSRK